MVPILMALTLVEEFPPAPLDRHGCQLLLDADALRPDTTLSAKSALHAELIKISTESPAFAAPDSPILPTGYATIAHPQPLPPFHQEKLYALALETKLSPLKDPKLSADAQTIW